MRSVDLALYADMLAGRASTLAAEVERARARLRQGAIEREALHALHPGTAERLERLGLLKGSDPAGERERIAELAAGLAALEELQAWVEERLFAAREEGYAMSE
jgi:hypothetical protein